MSYSMALVLLAAIDGIATPLRRSPDSGMLKAFRDVMRDCFPWSAFGVTDPRQIDAASVVLFAGFRNLLAHGSGSLPPGHGQGPEFDFQVTRHARAYSVPDLRKLETRSDPPEGFPLTCFGTYMFVLNLDQFYWGTRQLVHRWASTVRPNIAAKRKRALVLSVDGHTVDCRSFGTPIKQG